MTESNEEDNIQILIGYGSGGAGGTQLFLTPNNQIVGTVHPEDAAVLAAILRDAADAIESTAFAA